MLRRLNLHQWFLPCCLLGLFLVGLGGKLWLISAYGTPVPDLAQWRGGIPALAPEWAEGHLTLGTTNTPASFPLLAQVVFAFLIHSNQQWDERLTLVVNAALQVGGMVLFLAGCARRLRWPALWSAAFCAAILLVLPIGWSQSLAGSALPDRLAFFLLFPSLWALCDRGLGSPYWWHGAIGFLLAQTAANWAGSAAPALALVALAHLLLSRNSRGRDFALLGLAGTALLLHLWLYPGCWRQLTPPSAETLATAFSQTHPLLVLAYLLPLILRLVLGWRDPERKHAMAPVAVLLVAGATAILCIVAEPPASRCGQPGAVKDILILLVTLGLASLTQIWEGRRRLSLRVAMLLAWIALLILGIQFRLETITTRELPARGAENKLRAAQLAFLLAVPEDCEPEEALLADTELSSALRSSKLRALMPYSLRPPVPVVSGPSISRDFVPLRHERFDLPTPSEPAWAGGPASTAEGETLFISLPLPPSRMGVLRFRVAGDLGTKHFPFALRSLRTGETAVLQLDTSTGERWRTVNLPRPAEPVVIIAGPASLGAWGAFTQPVEMGIVSWYAGKLAKSWALVMGLGAGCFALAFLLPFAPRGPRRQNFALDRDGRIHAVSVRD